MIIITVYCIYLIGFYFVLILCYECFSALFILCVYHYLADCTVLLMFTLNHYIVLNCISVREVNRTQAVSHFAMQCFHFIYLHYVWVYETYSKGHMRGLEKCFNVFFDVTATLATVPQKIVSSLRFNIQEIHFKSRTTNVDMNERVKQKRHLT